MKCTTLSHRRPSLELLKVLWVQISNLVSPKIELCIVNWQFSSICVSLNHLYEQYCYFIVKMFEIKYSVMTCSELILLTVKTDKANRQC